MAKRKTPLMQLIEVRHGEPIDRLLSRLYWDEGLTLEQISERLGVAQSTLLRWMERFDIPTRPAAAVASA